MDGQVQLIHSKLQNVGHKFSRICVSASDLPYHVCVVLRRYFQSVYYIDSIIGVPILLYWDLILYYSTKRFS